jgi:hypothetical protein
MSARIITFPGAHAPQKPKRRTRKVRLTPVEQRMREIQCRARSLLSTAQSLEACITGLLKVLWSDDEPLNRLELIMVSRSLEIELRGLENAGRIVKLASAEDDVT